MDKIIGIYKITSPTGRVYIGKSKDISRRWKTYKKHDCVKQPKLYASLDKYGHDSHIFEIIEECEKGVLKIRERFWQDKFDVLNGGLNCVLTETDELEFEMSEETRKKMSDSMLGNKNPMFEKTGKLNSFFGKTHSDEQKQKWSETRKGKNLGKDHHSFGIPKSEEQRKAQSLRMIGKYLGEKSPMWGKKIPQEQIERFKATKKANGSGEKGNHPLAEKVINIETLETWDWVKDAAKKNSLCYQSLLRYLNGTVPNKTSLVYLKDYNKGIITEFYAGDKGVEVIDVITRVVYISVTKAAELNNLNKGTLGNYLAGDCINPTNLIMLRDHNNGLKPTDLYVDKSKRLIVIDYTTLERYQSMRKAALSVGISNSCLSEYLIGNSPNKTNLIYLKDYERGLKPEDIYIAKAKKVKPVINKIINKITLAEYRNISHAALVLGMCRKRLGKLIKNNSEDIDLMYISEYTKINKK